SILFVFIFLYSHLVPRDLHSFPTRRSSISVVELSLAAAPRQVKPRLFGAPMIEFRAAEWHESNGLIENSGSRRERETLARRGPRSEEHTSELQSRFDLVCRLLLEKKNNLAI